MLTKQVLTSTDVQKMIDACKLEAKANHWNVSIAIVDDGGYLLHVERTDGAGLLTPEIAIRKARTAALARIPTKLLEERLANRPALLKISEYLPMQGGVPIKVQDECIGGIGVSGVQSSEDEQIANAGIAALG